LEFVLLKEDMDRLTVGDLFDLIANGVENVEERVQQAFAWEFERSMSAVRLTLGAAASLFVAVLVAYLQEDVEVWQAGIGFGFTAVTFIYGLLRFTQLRGFARDYLAALSLTGEIRDVAPFLQLYRRGQG
jgi:hypothetical protein